MVGLMEGGVLFPRTAAVYNLQNETDVAYFLTTRTNMLLLYYQVMLLIYEHNYCARIRTIVTRQTPRAISAGSHTV